MDATCRFSRSVHQLTFLAALTFAAGVAGMCVSFLYLASAHQLDVIAGAAGFVAGAILAAGGLMSIAARAWALAEAPGATAVAPSMNVSRWLAHFRQNRENRPEPVW